jgi:hypothetical protein
MHDIENIICLRRLAGRLTASRTALTCAQRKRFADSLKSSLRKPMNLNACNIGAALKRATAAITQSFRLPKGFNRASLIQYGSDLRCKSLQSKRLAQELNAGIEHPAVYHSVLGVPSCE